MFYQRYRGPSPSAKCTFCDSTHSQHQVMLPSLYIADHSTQTYDAVNAELAPNIAIPAKAQILHIVLLCVKSWLSL